MPLQKGTMSVYHKPLLINKLFLIMKNLKFFYLFAFVFAGLILSSCGDDDMNDTNAITITIDEPMSGESIAMASCGDVHVHIDIVASVENHEVEIVLHPEGDTSNNKRSICVALHQEPVFT